MMSGPHTQFKPKKDRFVPGLYTLLHEKTPEDNTKITLTFPDSELTKPIKELPVQLNNIRGNVYQYEAIVKKGEEPTKLNELIKCLKSGDSIAQELNQYLQGNSPKPRWT